MSNNIQAEFKALQDNQKLLTIMIFSLVTVVVWVILSLVRSQRTTTIEPDLQTLSTSLNPSINTEVLSQIEQKRVYTEAELSSFPLYTRRLEEKTRVSPFSGQAVPTQPTALDNLTLPITSTSSGVTPTPTPTPTPAPTPEPTASSSGTL